MEAWGKGGAGRRKVSPPFSRRFHPTPRSRRTACDPRREPDQEVRNIRRGARHHVRGAAGAYLRAAWPQRGTGRTASTTFRMPRVARRYPRRTTHHEGAYGFVGAGMNLSCPTEGEWSGHEPHAGQTRLHGAEIFPLRRTDRAKKTCGLWRICTGWNGQGEAAYRTACRGAGSGNVPGRPAFNLPLGRSAGLAMACGATPHERRPCCSRRTDIGVDPGRAGNSGSTSTP